MPERDGTAQKPRLLDLFCGAGGCTAGYQDAGFYVVGVDITPQPNYCGDAFVQADALDVLREWHFETFDAIHASPPCQAYSAGGAMPNTRSDHPDLVSETRDLLRETGLPYVIENVEGAPLEAPVRLCGTALGLGADGHDLARHRLFEASFPLGLVPPCACGGRPVLGVYGDRAKTSRGTLTERSSRWSRPESLAVAREAMGIEWMTWREIRQAIPPAMTEFIGRQLFDFVKARPCSCKEYEVCSDPACMGPYYTEVEELRKAVPTDGELRKVVVRDA